MEIIGIDLSGPASPEKTAVARFSVGSEVLVCKSVSVNQTDLAIAQSITAPEVVIGIDAPLSYCPSGGSRKADQLLRKQVIACGLHPGSVMAPSAPKMAYLTLRGISLTRMLAMLNPKPRIVEVHPSATLALRGADIDDVRRLKQSPEARARLLHWLEGRGLEEIDPMVVESDHGVAACAAALAAWRWQRGECCWVFQAEPPVHPFDFAC